jgi:hypothetical protein
MPQIAATDKNGRRIVKAAWQPQIIFSVMLGGMAGLLMVRGLLSHRADWLQGAAVFGLLWAGFIAWFRTFALELAGEDLRYRAGLSRQIRIPLARIRSVHYRRITVGMWRSAGYQAVVIQVAGSPKSDVVVNARVFPEGELTQLFDEVASRGVHVNLK